MLRDNPAGLIEPMRSSAGANPLALCTAGKPSSDDRPPCLENPRPEGAESTLTENAASPFHAEPRQEHGTTDTQNISGRREKNRSGTAGTLGKTQGSKEGVVRYVEVSGATALFIAAWNLIRA
jgi:hypothetical protein